MCNLQKIQTGLLRSVMRNKEITDTVDLFYWLLYSSTIYYLLCINQIELKFTNSDHGSSILVNQALNQLGTGKILQVPLRFSASILLVLKILLTTVVA